MNPVEQTLRNGIDQLGLSVSDTQIDQLLEYLALLARWNKAYNLTAITDQKEMVAVHLLDSLAVGPYLTGTCFIDVGTGAGLPGIPLSILYPQKRFTLLDSNGKRVRFLFQVKTQLGLNNVSEINSRAENFQPERQFDGVISRAYSSLETMVITTAHLLSPGGRFYAMKGRIHDRELSSLPKPYNVSALQRLQVPGVFGERHLLEISLPDNGHTP